MKFNKSILIALIVAILFIPLFPGAQTLPADLSRLQPALRQLAAADGSCTVQVIVQAGGNGAKEQAIALGGRITRDLSIINAFSAEMDAVSVARLAANPLVRWISLDAAVERTGKTTTTKKIAKPQSANTYPETLKVSPVWQAGYTGTGIGVAVIDSGIADGKDFMSSSNLAVNRIIARYNLTADTGKTGDDLGHGTHVAGVHAGNGANSFGAYQGVAPDVNLISLRVSNIDGMATESDVIAAMQFVLEHKAEYNIRVVNLSINSTMEQSYKTSPLDAACEILWFNGVVVVVSAGNGGTGHYNIIKAPPANDPFVITVGAVDENGTSDRSDDFMANYSAKGITSDGFPKPNIVAPGSNIISVVDENSYWFLQYPTHIVDRYYFRVSGTSMAAPMVSGVVALMLQKNPTLTPDQVKYRLVSTGTRFQADIVYSYMDANAAVNATTTRSSNTGFKASQLLWTGDQPVTWDSVAWNSVAWNSVAWNSVAWNSVAWNSVAWNSVFMEP